MSHEGVGRTRSAVDQYARERSKGNDYNSQIVEAFDPARQNAPTTMRRESTVRKGGIVKTGVRRGLALFSLLIGGCGGDEEGRMSPGMTATAHGRDGKPVPVFFSNKTDHLPEGTVVQVISDGEGGPSEPRRKVVVGIQEGPSRGLAAQMYRSDLRPRE
jgi:hypothetical protein